MFRRILAAAAALAFLLPAAAVHAAPGPVLLGDVGVCDPWYPSTRCIKPNADGSVNIQGSVTAGTAFAPTGQASLAVTTTTARVALPAASANVTLVNTGAQTAYFLLGNGSVVATTATGYPLQSGSSITLAVGANTNVAAITSTSTTTLNVTSGTGVPALAGGGSTGGGGGGAVTVADGADVTQGAIGDGACATDNGITCTINSLIKRTNQRLTSTITALGSPFQAGGSIGNTGFAATFTAAASGTVVNTAGAGKPAGVDLFGAQSVILKNPADGTALSPTDASAVLCGATVGAAVQCAVASNQVLPDTAGAARVPQAGTSQRTLTATNLSSNTNTTICPTATNPVATEIYFTTSGVGVGLNGQTLTSAAPGATTTNSPDFAINTAGTLYTAPVGISNAITAYGAAGIVRCIQTLRQ